MIQPQLLRGCSNPISLACIISKYIETIPLSEQMVRRIEPLSDFWAHTERVTNYLRTHGAAAR